MPLPGWLVDAMAGAASVLLATGGAACARGAANVPLPIVAPIFEHGVGRASAGCVVVSPPVFLSEEEAQQIIGEELAATPLRFTQKSVEWRQVSFPQQQLYRDKPALPPVTLRVDGVDPQRRVAFKFVSGKRCFDFGVPRSGVSIDDHDTKQAAGNLREKLRQARTGEIYFGLFYDPLEVVPIDVDDCSNEMLPQGPGPERTGNEQCAAEWRATRDSARQLLRLQVRDFVGWLKAQGAI